MPKKITQRELRDDTSAIMRAIEHGESFVLTRNGTPITDLIPPARPAERHRVTGADLLAAGSCASSGSPMPSTRFRSPSARPACMASSLP